MGQDHLKAYSANFYKHLFGSPVSNFVSMDEDTIFQIPQLSPEENAVFTEPFTEKGVWDAISQMEQNKAR